jgi:hypothetical protein
MKTVFHRELRELPHRMGGVRGVLSVAALAAAGTLPPWRFGLGFLDPVFPIAYTSIAPLFAAFFTAQSFAGSRERQEIDNAPVEGLTDRDLAVGKILAATLYGWLAWFVIFGTALGSLASQLGGLARPPIPLLAAVALLAAAFAFGAAGLGAGVALNVFTAAAARHLFRLAFLFLLLAAVALPRVLPAAWSEFLTALVSRPRAVETCYAAAVVCAGAGLLGLRHAVKLLEERRAGLSIL